MKRIALWFSLFLLCIVLMPACSDSSGAAVTQLPSDSPIADSAENAGAASAVPEPSSAPETGAVLEASPAPKTDEKPFLDLTVGMDLRRQEPFPGKRVQ